MRYFLKQRADIGTQHGLTGHLGRKGAFESCLLADTIVSFGWIRGTLKYNIAWSHSMVRTDEVSKQQQFRPTVMANTDYNGTKNPVRKQLNDGDTIVVAYFKKLFLLETLSQLLISKIPCILSPPFRSLGYSKIMKTLFIISQKPAP